MVACSGREGVLELLDTKRILGDPANEFSASQKENEAGEINSPEGIGVVVRNENSVLCMRGAFCRVAKRSIL
jgi:hypothetical protein